MYNLHLIMNNLQSIIDNMYCIIYNLSCIMNNLLSDIQNLLFYRYHLHYTIYNLHFDITLLPGIMYLTKAQALEVIPHWERECLAHIVSLINNIVPISKIAYAYC